MLPCGAVELVLQYVGQKTWLCMAAVSKEWQSLYIMLYSAKETSRKHMQFAVRGGHLSMVQHLFESRCPLHKSDCEDAVHLGHVDFAVHGGMCAGAASANQTHMLRFLHERGASLEDVHIYGREDVEMVSYLRQHGWKDTYWPWQALCILATSWGNTELLKWAHEVDGLPLDWRACWEAANRGRIRALEYIFDRVSD
jgi:hypothetical protein